MRKLWSIPDIIVVDKGAGAKNGPSQIFYQKEERDELWLKDAGSAFQSPNVHVLTGKGDIADREGDFLINLKPGGVYEAAIYEEGHGPFHTDPIRLAHLTVYCIWKKPEVRTLITDHNRSAGGTWYKHQIATNVSTDIVLIGVSTDPPQNDSNNIPHFKDPEGNLAEPTFITQNHLVEFVNLRPGNHYFFSVMVVDEFGNWETFLEPFDTMRRKLTVEFTTLHIYNDGDPMGHGEGEFWFTVSEGSQVSEEFHMPTSDIDDWNETDRPYSLGFAHLGSLKNIVKGQESVQVMSRGIEHDGFLESDEVAGLLTGVSLPLPSGSLVETVTNSPFFLDCPVATTGDDFHYGVDIKYSVEYLP
jgi:hypothetical protein